MGSDTGQKGGSRPQVAQIDDAKIGQLLKPRGRPLLVNFWATWCGPCREEFPDLVAIDAEFRGKIDFFTVSLDAVEEIDAAVPAFLGEMNAGMPAYLLVSADENAMVRSVAENWSGALPFTVLYDGKGEIVYSRQGKVDPGTLKGEIERTLGKQ
jgi:thiol-disulfide isomerase/thioredoxin